MRWFLDCFVKIQIILANCMYRYIKVEQIYFEFSIISIGLRILLRPWYNISILKQQKHAERLYYEHQYAVVPKVVYFIVNK